MKNIWKILFFVFYISCLFLLKPRQDVVISAVDMSQYIKLYEEDRDFVLCMDANNILTGTYTILMDTVYLSYREIIESSTAYRTTGRSEYNNTLPRKLYIDASASNITSRDGALFSAEIQIDQRQEPYQENLYAQRDLNGLRAQIFPLGQAR
jgi:hypothetical protein